MCYRDEGWFYLSEDIDITSTIITQTLYVDLNDIETPLKYLYESVGYVMFNSSETYGRYRFNVERNELELEDNWWEFLSQPSKILMNSIKYLNFQQYDKDYSKITYKLDISLGNITNQFGRKVLNFLEVTGVIGGIFELLDIIIGAIISFIYSQMLKKELQKDLVIAQSEIVKLQDSIKKILNKDSGI